MPSTGVEFKYAIGTCLFEGDRQAVYETEFEGTPAVVKFIRPQTSFEGAKLISQLAAAAKLQHPNLVRILDFGETEVFETHVLFVVSERGEVHSADARGDVAAALAFLHGNGYAHGSVKPTNVFGFGDAAKLTAESIHPAEDGDKEADLEALNSVFGEPEPANPVPRYRKRAALAIGGVVAAAALCLLLMRNAEHKSAPPPVTMPVVQQQAPPVTAEPLKPVVTPKGHAHRRTRARHKRK